MAGPSEKMDAFIARFDELTPTDFTRFSKDYTPDGTDVYTLTGRAVDKIPPIPVDHGFYMSINNVAAGKGSPLHRHVQPEMFVVLSGDWTFFWGEKGENEVNLGPLDTISFPAGTYEGYRNVGDAEGKLLAVLSGSEIGEVSYPKGSKDA